MARSSIVLLTTAEVRDPRMVDSSVRKISLPICTEIFNELYPHTEIDYLEALPSGVDHGIALADLLDSTFRKTESLSSASIYANDCYWYIYKQVGLIVELIENEGVENVDIVVPKLDGFKFRRHLIKTMEFPSGSIDSYLETIMFFLGKYRFSGKSPNFVQLKEQSHSIVNCMVHELIRKGKIVFSGLYLALRHRGNGSNRHCFAKKKNIVICRTQKHLDLVGLNYEELGEPGVFYFPQVISGKIVIPEMLRTEYVTPSRFQLIHAFVLSISSVVRSLNSAKMLQKCGYQNECVSFEIDAGEVAFDLILYTPLRIHMQWGIENEIRCW